MRNILLLIPIIVFQLHFHAQSAYVKMLKEDTTTWQHFNCIPGVSQNQRQALPYLDDHPIVAIDTITFNSYKYFRLYELNYYSLNYANPFFVGYIREDTIARRVYFTENASSPEYLLYDFSTSVNDSIYLTFPTLPSNTGYYKLDSITTKTEISGSRQHFYYRKHTNNTQPNNNYYDFIEGIGCTAHALYLLTGNNYQSACLFSSPGNSCNHVWGLGLACKHNDLSKEYQSCTFAVAAQINCISTVDSCDYRNVCNGIKKHDIDNVLSVKPNPAQDFCEIEIFNSYETIQIEIYGISGQLIKTCQPKAKNKSGWILNTTDLANGIYLMQIRLNEKVYRTNLIVQHDY